MVDRKIIFKCRVGSHLYGTSHPDSDEDFCGVFLPSTRDMMGLGNCSTEWTESVKESEGPRNTTGDVDCKYFSLRRFLDLVAQGQPGQLEMMFAPESAIVISTPEWESILEQRHLFIAQSAIKPFIGFAMAQSYKASIKGENLNLLRDLIGTTEADKSAPLSNYLFKDNILFPLTDITFRPIPVVVNEQGFPMITIAGRSFDIGIKCASFLTALEGLASRYGTRVEVAAEKGQDFKSLMHAYRLIGQGEEFLRTGRITFPRSDVDFLLQVRNGSYVADYQVDLQSRLDALRAIESPLPASPDRSAIEKLCIELHEEHLCKPS